MNLTVHLAAALLLLGCASAQAATQIHRCGNAYSDQPCAAARTFAVETSLTAEQRADARQVASREKALAEEMARDRRAQEAAVRPAGAASLSGSRGAEPAAPAKKDAAARKKPARTEDGRDFVAAVPKAKKAGS